MSQYWVFRIKMKYKKIEYKNKSRIYDFEYYSLGTRSDFNTEFTPGIYYCCHSYGRELATHEVKQNYNALKSRFNI